jgi:hypothetical protein
VPPFTIDRWRLLSPYLDEALQMDTDERTTWLASIVARDASLAADLQMLLAEHDTLNASRFLERPVRGPLDEIAERALKKPVA